MKLSVENVSTNLHDLELVHGFLAMISKIQATEEETITCTSLK